MLIIVKKIVFDLFPVSTRDYLFDIFQTSFLLYSIKQVSSLRSGV